MSRFARPEALGPYLDEHVRALAGILEGVDASPMVVFGRLEALARTWAQVHRRILQPFGINYAELTALGMLRTTPGGACTPSDLRGLVGQTSAGMTRILDKLVTAGLVKRAPHTGDGRRVEVRLTERGTNFAEQCLDALLSEESSILADLDETRLEGLVAGIDALLDAFAERR